MPRAGWGSVKVLEGRHAVASAWRPIAPPPILCFGAAPLEKSRVKLSLPRGHCAPRGDGGKRRVSGFIPTSVAAQTLPCTPDPGVETAIHTGYGGNGAAELLSGVQAPAEAID